jgi:type II secretion system protein H
MRTPPRLRVRGDASGFTLLEVLVILVVFAIVLAAGTPAVTRAMAAASVDNAATVIAGDLEQAFTLAARQRAPVRVEFDASNKRYYIKNRAGTALRTRNLGATSDLEVETISPSASIIDVFPNGRASGPLVVDLARAGQSARVTMTRAGKVRIIT